MFSKKNILFIIIFGFTTTSSCQINESINTGVYEYMYRMAQKGFIDWNDYQLPLDRKEVFMALDRLSIIEGQLTRVEASELKFYRQEYSFDSLSITAPEKKYILKKDSSGRFRTGLFENGQSKLFIDPLIGLQYFIGNGKNNTRYFSGIRLGGYFGEHWGFNFSFRDNTEKGDTLLGNQYFSTTEGAVSTIQTGRLLNYSNLNFNIGYKWSQGSISAGKENLSWGYGLNGNIALSGKAPSYPFIKFDYKPWVWLHFNYFHGWLHSNIIDSAQTYNTGTGVINSQREIFRPKFIAHHSLNITPVKGLNVSIGESIVYSDKLNIAYLMPVNFFKIYDHYASRYNIKAGDNSQFFGLISSRNQIKNTHFYAQLFIDEIRASKVFNKREKRNQLAYTLGISRTDLFINYLTAGIEYSRINPFVYNNLIPGQTYQSHSYPMGDWMGNNADRIFSFLQYVPLPKMRIRLWQQKNQKRSKRHFRAAVLSRATAPIFV